ncbi:hypothetical protein KIW84_073635 [Lathyrus oleraceus]|uniref:ADP-ribosyl cyclase/cyclic ADP-ribose hydrolase n=1 Tax=Pisum sativum TaxID=3888 RepID=A0A9D4VQK6_PEA|nr:hypothetical protein KIW84_073635 [Pisum sativum]
MGGQKLQGPNTLKETVVEKKLNLTISQLEENRCKACAVFNLVSAALQRKGIYAFRDDTKLNKGESIAPELLRVIQHSQIFIVVFSKNYASSTWCLRELEHILLHCGQPPEKRLLPVFYDVDPSDVRHQKGTYDEALAKHEQRFQQDSDKVRRWREVLAQVADLSGWDVRHK